MAKATSTRGLLIYMSKAATATVEVVPTAITKAKPAVVTVASTTGINDGDIVYMSGTQYAELDGRPFIVTAKTATDFTLKGSDTTNTAAAALGSSPKATVTSKAAMISLCLSSIEPSTEQPGTVSVATFCDPSASIPSSTTSAGTVTLTGFVDITDPAYAELVLAAEDSKQRMIDVVLPNAQGDIVVPVTLASIGWSLPIEGAVGFTASGSLGSKPRHVF